MTIAVIDQSMRSTGLFDAEETRTSAVARLAELRAREPCEECQIAMPDAWVGALLIALLHDWGLDPYRYARQRSTTLIVSVPPTFANEILMPELQKLTDVACARFGNVTRDLIAELFPRVKQPVTIGIKKSPSSPG
jgi:hypothetical protein